MTYEEALMTGCNNELSGLKKGVYELMAYE